MSNPSSKQPDEQAADIGLDDDLQLVALAFVEGSLDEVDSLLFAERLTTDPEAQEAVAIAIQQLSDLDDSLRSTVDDGVAATVQLSESSNSFANPQAAQSDLVASNRRRQRELIRWRSVAIVSWAVAIALALFAFANLPSDRPTIASNEDELNQRDSDWNHLGENAVTDWLSFIATDSGESDDAVLRELIQSDSDEDQQWIQKAIDAVQSDSSEERLLPFEPNDQLELDWMVSALGGLAEGE